MTAQFESHERPSATSSYSYSNQRYKLGQQTKAIAQLPSCTEISCVRDHVDSR